MKMENFANNIVLNIDKSIRMKSGIYKLIIEQDIYVGSATNLYTRINKHKNQLIKNTHYNLKVQRKFNKHLNLSYEVLEFCEISQLVEREQFYLDTLKPKLNIMSSACRTFNRKISEEHRQITIKRNTDNKHSQETKDKISETLKGSNLSEKVKSNISKGLKELYKTKLNKKAKLTLEQADEIRKRLSLGELIKDLAKEYKVSRIVIYDIRDYKIYNKIKK